MGTYPLASVGMQQQKLMLRIRKTQVNFSEHMMRKEDLENLAPIRHNEDKRKIGKQLVIYLRSLSEWEEKQRHGSMVKE